MRAPELGRRAAVSGMAAGGRAAGRRDGSRRVGDHARAGVGAAGGRSAAGPAGGDRAGARRGAPQLSESVTSGPVGVVVVVVSVDVFGSVERLTLKTSRSLPEP